MPSIDPVPVPALLVVAGFASAVPDFRSATIIPLAVVAGGLLGTAVARLRRVHRPRMREITENYAFAAGGVATSIYVFTLVTGI